MDFRGYVHYIQSEGAQTFARLQSVILSRMNTHREKFIIAHNGKCPHPRFRWRKSFHDHMIRDDRDFRGHVHYIQSAGAQTFARLRGVNAMTPKNSRHKPYPFNPGDDHDRRPGP
jgi:hypothetical protein